MNFYPYFSCFSTYLCEIWYGRPAHWRWEILNFPKFDAVKAVLYTLHGREGGGKGCWIFPDFLLFRPNCIKFGTQAISTWIYRLLLSFVKTGVNEFMNCNFYFYCPVWVELGRGDLHIMLLSSFESFEFFEVGSIRELEKLHNEELQNSDFSPWSTLVVKKSHDDDDDDDDDDDCVCVCVCVCVCLNM